MKKKLFFFLIFSGLLTMPVQKSTAQLKFLIEDFEGCAEGFSESDSKQNGFFTFGNISSFIIHEAPSSDSYIGQRYIQLNRGDNVNFGGWGKGIGANVELNHEVDYLNFYFRSAVKESSIEILLQEDDNGNGIYDKNFDDVWTYSLQLKSESGNSAWKLYSISLNSLKDDNDGGDGVFNINYKQGKLLCLIFNFLKDENNKTTINSRCYFDFLCFSKGVLPTGTNTTDAPLPSADDHCNLGLWSKEGVTADFIDIANSFDRNFKNASDKKLSVVHFFLPLAIDGSTSLNNFPEVAGINRMVKRGYVPMITLEDHFVNVRPRVKQPDLYTILEGHFDPFFKEWAEEIKKVNGVVLVRLLHEFNGDWYPWCISKNNNDPVLLIKAFRHIHTIFKEQKVVNVKFIWCPNSTSFPQESWNYIMDAYPGDNYVDFVGLDIYNGAGQDMPVWRSFRKEGIENYFILTEKLPHKPLFICETASRERMKKESGKTQTKAEWIEQMSEALKTDMSKIRLLSWFNEKESFRISSSPEAKAAYLNCILLNDYFKSDSNSVKSLVK